MTSDPRVDEYLAQVPEGARAALENLRRTIKAAAPSATETISYAMPTFKYEGKSLASYAAFKNHCSLFPCSGGVLERFQPEIGALRTSKGTIRFSPDEPLPAALVKKLVKARMEEIESRGKRKP